jgi:8-oxo-dGTP pyrophosphatase MutT (NUDIX family)
MTYPVWVNESWVEVPIPEMSGEPLVVPNVAAIVLSETGDEILLQKRDKPGEPVRGKYEIPGGRWGAGEAPEVALAREVKEETGLDLTEPVAGSGRVVIGPNRSCGYVRPIAAVAGLEGTYPSLHVVMECVASGEPVALPGETADPRWWPIEDLKRLLHEAPERFVDQTRTMLTVYFDGV